MRLPRPRRQQMEKVNPKFLRKGDIFSMRESESSTMYMVMRESESGKLAVRSLRTGEDTDLFLPVNGFYEVWLHYDAE